jgi:tRNA-Thr(GGU) m(6)t(6)A37 methyltransferase TsaA
MPSYEPIGVVRSPFKEKKEAPRQGTVLEATGVIELFPRDGFEHALSDIEGFERIIVLFHFDQVEGWNPKVLPPRSSKKRGLFATRSPHRPNPIGLTIVRLLGVRGLCLDVQDLDILDGTPVLDLKPYVPYADAFPNSRAGWLDEESGVTRTSDSQAPKDPIDAYEVLFAKEVEPALAWLQEHGRDLRSALVHALSLGPAPHPYRRIRVKDGVSQIAVKDFRATFTADAKRITVTRIFSGYSDKELASREGAELDLHRAFVGR